MFKSSPTVVGSSAQVVDSYRGLSSLREYPMYYFLLVLASVGGFSFYPLLPYLPIPFTSNGQRWALVIFSLAVMAFNFSPLSYLRKKKLGVIMFTLLWAPTVVLTFLFSWGNYFGVFQVFAFAVGHYLLFSFLLYATHHPDSKKGWLVIWSIFLLVLWAFLQDLAHDRWVMEINK